MIRLGMVFAAAVLMSVSGGASHAKMTMQTFPVLAGAGPHDVYLAPDGAVWFTAQSAGKLGRLDPRTGKSDLIALGPGAAPHGVIVGPDGAPGSPKAGIQGRRAGLARAHRSRDGRGVSGIRAGEGPHENHWHDADLHLPPCSKNPVSPWNISGRSP
jgi:hypothetical protein